MKGNKIKLNTDCAYDLVLARFHHETVSDLGKHQAQKFKRTVGINPKVLQMIFFGYQIPSTKSTVPELEDQPKVQFFVDELHEAKKAG